MLEIFESLPQQTLTTFRRLALLGVTTILLLWATFFRAFYYDYFPLQHNCQVYHDEQSSLGALTSRVYHVFLPFIKVDRFLTTNRAEQCEYILKQYTESFYDTIYFDAAPSIILSPERKDFEILPQINQPHKTSAAVGLGDFLKGQIYDLIFPIPSHEPSDGPIEIVDVQDLFPTQPRSNQSQHPVNNDLNLMEQLFYYTTAVNGENFQFYITTGIAPSFHYYYNLLHTTFLPPEYPDDEFFAHIVDTQQSITVLTLENIRDHIIQLQSRQEIHGLHSLTSARSNKKYLVVTDYIEYLQLLQDYHHRHHPTHQIIIKLDNLTVQPHPHHAPHYQTIQDLFPHQQPSPHQHGDAPTLYTPLHQLLATVHIQHLTLIDLLTLLHIAVRLSLVFFQFTLRVHYLCSILSLGLNLNRAWQRDRNRMTAIARRILSGFFYQLHLRLGQWSLNLFKISFLLTLLPIVCSPKPILAYTHSAMILSVTQYCITTLVAVSESEFLMREYYRQIDSNAYGYALEPKMSAQDINIFTITALYGWLKVWQKLNQLTFDLYYHPNPSPSDNTSQHPQSSPRTNTHTFPRRNSTPILGISNDTEEFILQQVQYAHHWLKSITHDTCSICLIELDYDSPCVLLPCKHILHSVCFQQWALTKKAACPICMALIRLSNNNGKVALYYQQQQRQAEQQHHQSTEHHQNDQDSHDDASGGNYDDDDDDDRVDKKHSSISHQSLFTSIDMPLLRANYEHFFLHEYTHLFHHYNERFTTLHTTHMSQEPIETNHVGAAVNFATTLFSLASPGGVTEEEDTEEDESINEDTTLLSSSPSLEHINSTSLSTYRPEVLWDEQMMQEVMFKFTQVFLLRHHIHPSQLNKSQQSTTTTSTPPLSELSSSHNPITNTTLSETLDDQISVSASANDTDDCAREDHCDDAANGQEGGEKDDSCGIAEE